ncbi:cytochrome P450 [Sistotremastrum niveocremeum HHB9708]|uniref:Cytochrome P450 n=1 Tax=Sistotremastrum niveocremeum HHB9708 TaxID=1314777 RepID=A0A164VD25_9AGAM|nr:cytochrome P450 [Sistotremastrum niveocremeum HHB9708]
MGSAANETLAKTLPAASASLFNTQSLSYIIFLSFLVAGMKFWYGSGQKKGYERLPFPPGPKGIPILGNALQLPLKAPWIKFKDWAAVHGDVFYLSMMGQHVVVLNSYESGLDLLHKRGAIYSDRPGMALVRDHGGWKFSIVTEPYGDIFHLKRRYINQALNPSGTKKQYNMLNDNMRLFIQSLLQNPSKIQAYNRMYTGANIMMMTYGHQVTGEDDEYIRNADDAMITLEASGTIGAHPIDMWPILGSLPFSIWGKKFADHMVTMKKTTDLVSTLPYDNIKQKFFDGTAVPSMATSLLEENLNADKTINNEECINGSLAIVYIAGADTTVASIDTFIIAMMLNPDVQREAQETIDELLQGERLPTWEDRESLPYVEAILKEVLRWKPVVPGGIPHRSIQDDEYNGQFIPKGTMMIFNVLAMMYNPKEFPDDPEGFNPRRFLKSDGGKYDLRTDVRDPADIAFGFGRRVCPGRHFADAWLWLSIATLLATFEISLELDAAGNPILPDLEYEVGLVSHPKPYKCLLKPRSQMASLLASEFNH